MNKRTQNRNEREVKMIQAAMQIFDIKGIELTKMTDIAKKTEMGVASVYRYFNTKIDLALEVGCQYWVYVLKYLKAIDTKTCTGLEGLNKMMRVYTDHDPQLIAFFRFIEQLDAFISKVDVPEERLKKYESHVMSIEPVFDELLRRGLNDGSLKSDIDAHKHYTMITHAITALKQKHCSRGVILSSDSEELLEEEMHTIIDIYIDYLRP